MNSGFEPTQASPELGLVCITASNQVRFRALTRKRLLQLSVSEQAQTLRALYLENLRRLDAAVEFCHHANIRLYRLGSSLFPFADEPLGLSLLSELSTGLQQVGERATQQGVRLVLHPDQFVVLSSDRPEVIANSIKILSAQAQVFDWMGLPRSPWALMNIHGGKGDRAERLVQVIRDLPEAIRLRLTLENDEYTYSTADLLKICQAAEVPLVFDAHHHLIHERLESYDDPSVADCLAAARQTWPIPAWQVVHISNGREFLHDPRHSEYITQMPSAYRQAPWIEVEARQKENAIAHLQQTWLTAQSAAQSAAQSTAQSAATEASTVCGNIS